MSYASFFGAMFNTFAFAALWMILGKFVETLCKAFNRIITVVPSFQDAVNGFNILQTAWMAVLVIVVLIVWINYILNANEQTNMTV